MTDPEGSCLDSPPAGGGAPTAQSKEGGGFWVSGNRYVGSFQEWQSCQKSDDRKAVYPAYVQSISTTIYGQYLGKYGYVFGCNEKPSGDDCGKIYRKIQCSQNSDHDPYYRHIHCNDPGCPICYTKFVDRQTKTVVERVLGYKTVYRGTKPYHLILWGKKCDGRPYAGCRAAFVEAKRLLKILGVVSASVWYHPYRIKEELKLLLRRYRRAKDLDGKIGFWKLAHDDVLGIGGLENYIVYGPHWHAIATGYLMDVKDFARRTGCGYKKRGYVETEERLRETAYYISSHAAREAGRHSVIYYGDISYRKLSKELSGVKIEDVKCKICGSMLHEYDVDEDGNYRKDAQGIIIGLVKEHITEKIKFYIYWKRGTEKPKRNGGAQCLIDCGNY